MHSIWMQKFPQSTITEQGLLNQKRSIEKNRLLTTTQLQEIDNRVNNTTESEVNNSMETTSNDVQHSPAIDDAIEEIERLTDEQQQLKCHIIECMARYENQGARPVIGRVYIDAALRQMIKQVNTAVAHIQTRDVSELNTLMYAAAKVVEESVIGVKRHHQATTPPWKRRLQQQIDNLRTEVNRLKAAKEKNGRLPRYMYYKYHMEHREISEVLEDAKQRLIALSHRLKRYEKRNEQYRINKLFRSNPQKVYRELKGESVKDTSMCNKEELKEFWQEMWEQPVAYNTEAEWLSVIETKCEEIPVQEDVAITAEDVKYKLESMSNWKAPGPDKLQVFWIKQLTSLHDRLANNINTLLQQPHMVPEWLVTGRTLLLRKDESKPPTPSNFRPITCLPTMWKLFTGVLTNKISRHMRSNKIMHYEQKGNRAKCRGTKDQLAIDRTITNDSKRRHTNLSMAWIDYRKAFDSLPHAWIVKCMNLYKVPQNIQNIVKSSMQLWKTTLFLGKEEIGSININRGIFQGDSLSPMLFCMAMNPLSDILHQADRSYKLKSGKKINHLLYVDDLKLYGRTEKDINTLIHVVRKFSDDVCMKFGVEKCARLIIHRGNVVETEGLDIEGDRIRDVSEDGYKYLGIPQHRVNMDNIAKARAISEYKKRIRKIMKSELYAMHKIEAINTYAMPVISYTGGVVKWTVQELSELNRQTRKLLNMYGGVHPRADVDRLYLPRDLGGRGLKDIAETIEMEDRSLTDYLYRDHDDPLLAVVTSSGLYRQRSESLVDWKKKTLEDRRQKWRQKAMHGQYSRQVEALTSTKACFGWLKSVKLKMETEALLTAAQDQALNTKAHATYILKSSRDPKCRLCNSADETVAHLLTSCSKLAATEYLTRHNEVARLVHRNICEAHGVEVTHPSWQHAPQPVTETDHAKILWDFEIRTDRRITARRPDIVIVNKERREGLIIDIAVPEDRNICEKEREKIDKYQDLKLEMMKLWNIKVKVVPVVIGALGAHTGKLSGYLAQIPGQHNIPQLIKAALLGSAHILRRSLDLPESW